MSLDALPQPVGRYERYIASREWRASPARLLELSMAERRCRLCDRGEPEASIEVHHRTYIRLGCERPSDLCTLCRDCHRLVTTELRKRRFASSKVPLPSDTPRTTPTLGWRDRAHFEEGAGRG